MPKIIFQPLMICNPPSKKVRPIKTGGFVIPQQKEKHTSLLRIANPQSLNRLGHFLTPDCKSGETPSGNKELVIPCLEYGVLVDCRVSGGSFTLPSLGTVLDSLPSHGSSYLTLLFLSLYSLLT